MVAAKVGEEAGHEREARCLVISGDGSA